MPSSFYRKLIKLLKEGGCHFERQGKGSHEIWYSPITKAYFPVPVTIDKATSANGILKQAGLAKGF